MNVSLAFLTAFSLLTPQVSETPRTAGAISGILRYPSEEIPPMRIYAIREMGGTHFSVKTARGQATFTIKGVAPGRYYLVAYTDEAPDLAGGWSRAVLCGLKVSCTDHTLIPVTVTAGKSVTGVTPSDWYAKPGTFPCEPSSSKDLRPTTGIRAVDFRNFTYNVEGRESIAVRCGRGTGDDADGFDFGSVKYVDFNADGIEDALVIIGATLFPFVLKQGVPAQAGEIPVEKPTEIRTDGSSLVIVEPHWRDSDPGCCPSGERTRVFRWEDSKFVLLSNQVKPR